MSASRTLLVVLSVSALAIPCRARAQSGEEPGPIATPSGAGDPDEGPAVVRARDLPLFQLRATVGRLSPRARAVQAEHQLAEVLRGSSVEPQHVRVEHLEAAEDLLVGDRLVLTIVDLDARPVGRTRQQLAADYASALRALLDEERGARSLEGLIRGLALAALAALVSGLVLFLLWRGAARALARLGPGGGARIPAMRVQKLELLSSEQIAGLLSEIIVIAWAVASLVIVVVCADVVLGLFPWTRPLAGRMNATIISALEWVAMGVLDYLPNLFYIALILLAARYVLHLAHLMFKALEHGRISIQGFFREWADPTYKIVRFLILALTMVVVFPYLPGSSSPAFQGISIFLGVLFSLGSSSAISNIVAGVVLTYMRPFQLGDRVRIADTVGDVLAKNLLVVRIRTIKNVEVTIANSMVLGHHIVNYSACARAPGLILSSTVTIGYDAPWRIVHELLIAAATATPGISSSPSPFVHQTSLNDFYVSYEINAFTDRPNSMAELYAALHQNIQDKFNEAGVEIMSPHYFAARDGNRVTLPPDHLPDSYEPPAFNVRTRADGP